MTLADIVEKTHATIVVDNPEAQVTAAYTGDLLSDVMGHCGDESVLITVQSHLNTIAVCTLVGVEVIVVCHNRPVPDDMRDAATREGVGIVVTPLSQFEATVALADLHPATR